MKAGASSPSFTGRPISPLLERVQESVQQATKRLLSLQDQEGFWMGELEGDTILESEYAVLLNFLGRHRDPRIPKLARYILEKQNAEGGWSLFPGGPPDVSASVKAYWTLKLAGYSSEDSRLRRARRRILEMGGVDQTNSFTKIYLCLLGLYDWSKTPAIPPQMILFPTWFTFNLYEMSSWSRAIFVPLSIVWARKPAGRVPPHACIDELFLPEATRRRENGSRGRRHLGWDGFFRGLDRWIKTAANWRLLPFQEMGIRACERWMLDHFRKTHGLAAIFPPMVNAVMAMKALRYPDSDSHLQWMLDELQKLEIEDGDRLRLQPCFSPVWDTAIAVNALSLAGLPSDHVSLRKACCWLLDREVKEQGDWSVKVGGVEPGGWYFEFENEFYPDVDDTAMVLMALTRTGLPDSRRQAAMGRGLAWLLKMQNRNGGWAAFDKDNDKWILTQVPFADHNAMIDPSTPDLTARVLELLGCQGYTVAHPAVRRALGFLKKEQCADGSWFGRWGVNYIYGTWQVLRGLHSVHEDMRSDYVEAAARWLRSIQNQDGGWGESCLSYDDPAHKGRGPSTPSQTAWALMGLFAAGDFSSSAVRRGVSYLLEKQNDAGGWVEKEWTGTGFPRVFYLKYHLYPLYFPLMALGMYQATSLERMASGGFQARSGQ